MRNNEAEKRNIAVLNRKWPGAFRMNPKRRNEVIMRWNTSSGAADADDAEDEDEEEKGAGGAGGGGRRKAAASRKRRGVRKTAVKMRVSPMSDLSPTAVLLATGKTAKSPYITARCKMAAGKTVEKALSSVRQKGARRYMLSDLRYDLRSGFLRLGGARAR